MPLLLFLVLFFGAAGVIRSVAEAALCANAASAMYEAIEATLSGVGYDDLIEVERSDTGEIAAMTADAQRINTIARDAAYLAQKNFGVLAEAGVKVPLGAFSGIEALSGFGPPRHLQAAARGCGALLLPLRLHFGGHQSDAPCRLSRYRPRYHRRAPCGDE